MRTIFIDPAYSAQDVKPTDLLDEYKARLETDVKAILGPASLTTRPCPACQSANTVDHFEKFGLTYGECAECGTVYVQNAPDDDAIAEFYRTSGAEVFWQDHLAVETHASRMDRIVEPRAAWVADGIAEYLGKAHVLLDIGCQFDGYATAFENLEQIGCLAQLRPVASGLSETSPQPDQADAAILFESLDRTIDVEGIMEELSGLLPKAGLAFVTGILASGFEFQVLRQASESLLPPDRMNLFTIEGWTQLFDRHGFDVVELSTPGRFDLSLVADKAAHDLPGFVRYLIDQRSQEDHLRFQEFLQSSLLSGMGRALIRKR